MLPLLSRQSILFWSAIAALIAANALFQIRLAHDDSQTNDEAAHLVSGYSYWTTGDWRLNPEHPPLSKLAAALPLLGMGLQFHPDAQSWANADEFALGRQFLYRNIRPADDILFRARIVTICFAAALILVIAAWALQRFGPFPALIAAVFAAFDPILLSHGHYVTSDVPVTLFYFCAILAWVSWLEEGGRKRLLMTGVFTGLALATKFSALLLFPAFLALLAFRRRRIQWEHALYLCIVPFLIVWATYGFDIRTVTGDPRIGPRLSAISPLAHVPIPAYYFFRGIQLLFRHAHSGHTAYLLGRLCSHGFVAYFPVAFLVKTPLGLLLALALASWPLLFLNRKWLWLAAAPATYFVISMCAGIDIGIRHILPIYPFLYLLVAAAASHSKRASAVALICASAVMVETSAAYPLWLGFFNAAAGGPLHGTRYLLDSNVDWGQDLKRLPAFLAENKIKQPCLAYFGEAQPAYYGISALPLDHVVDNCVMIVSAQLLFGSPSHPFAALEQRRPRAIVGSSLFVFDPENGVGHR
jgi:Dolichyl-phosphate-mannose-protein mannosyltransferase